MRDALMSILAARGVDVAALSPDVFALAQDLPGDPVRIHVWDRAALGAEPEAAEIAAAAAAGADWALTAARTRAAAEIDSQAEAARLAYITPGSGQALVYEAKRREAAERIRQHDAGAPPPPPGDFPFLEAEIGIAETPSGAAAVDSHEVARAILAKADAWTAAGAAIERLRRGAKRAIETAATQAEIDAILAGLTWPTP